MEARSLAGHPNGAAVTPSDTVNLPKPCKRLWIGGAGTGALKVDTLGGDTLTFAGVPIGWFDVQATRVYSTGTGVTNIVAVY